MEKYVLVFYFCCRIERLAKEERLERARTEREENAPFFVVPPHKLRAISFILGAGQKIEVDACSVFKTPFAGVDVFVSVCLRASFFSVFSMYSSW